MSSAEQPCMRPHRSAGDDASATVAQMLKQKGSQVHTIVSDESAQAAVARLSREDIGALVVLSDRDHVVGIISERDLTRAVAREGGAALQRKVADLMTRDVPFTTPNDSIEHVKATITAHRIRHLPVQKSHRLVGIVSIGDVVNWRITEAEMELAELRRHMADGPQFLAHMGHELRTPLNAVIGFSEIMVKEMFGPLGNARYIEYAENILESGQHLLSVINNMLYLSKAEADKLQLHEEEVDLTRTVTSCFRLVCERAAQEGVALNNRIGPLPLMRVDQRMMKQILLNLVTNAIKFSSTGGSVDVAGKLSDEGDFLLTVSDTGIGIAEEDIPRALQAFGQIDSVLTRTHEGTGLGLPLCKTLAELHGGSLSIASEVGRGTTVTVRLPRERIVA